MRVPPGGTAGVLLAVAGRTNGVDWPGLGTPMITGMTVIPFPRRRMDLVFNRKPPKTDEERSDVQSALVEMLLDADETERKRLLLMALQTGELKKSESAELLRLVERLEQISGRRI